MRAASTNGNELAVIAVPVPPGADGCPTSSSRPGGG